MFGGRHLLSQPESETWELSLPLLSPLFPIHSSSAVTLYSTYYILFSNLLSPFHTYFLVCIFSVNNCCSSPFICLLIFSLVSCQGMIFPKFKLDREAEEECFCLEFLCLLCDLIFKNKFFKMKHKILWDLVLVTF